MEEESCVPPGFRFHPTEEELVGYYLARKVASQKIDLEIIQEVDLYRIEPWDLQGRCKQSSGGGGQDDETEWYFFSYKDRKYPSGTRTNRATAAGFWKATGRDKPVVSSRSSRVIGMRKTLVFYRGRAPNGSKTDWIMHEYRLQSSEHAPTQEEGWVVCRAFQKPIPNQQQQHHIFHHPTPGYYLPNHHHFLGASPAAAAASGGNIPPFYFNNCPADDLLVESKTTAKHLLMSIPPLESPTAAVTHHQRSYSHHHSADDEQEQLIQLGGHQAIDWNFLDTLLSTTTSQQLHDPSSSSLLEYM